MMWTSDLSPYLTKAAASGMAVGITPSERYALDPVSGVNFTMQTVCKHESDSFNAGVPSSV